MSCLYKLLLNVRIANLSEPTVQFTALTNCRKTIPRRRITDISESTEDDVIDTVSTETIQPQKQKRKSGKEKEKRTRGKSLKRRNLL